MATESTAHHEWMALRGSNGRWKVYFRGTEVGGCTALEMRASAGEPSTLRLEFTTRDFVVRDPNPLQD